MFNTAMNTRPIRLLTTPARRLLAVLAFNLAAVILAIALALTSPWLGVTLQADPGGNITVLASQGPAVSVPNDVRLLKARAETGVEFMTLAEGDLMEEPDVVANYEEMDAFFERQSALAKLLRAPRVVVQWREDGNEAVYESILQPSARPWTALPALFWYQVAVAVTGCLIAGWVWALRPDDWGARMFAITGLSFPVFALSAAIYSSRELAIDGKLFAALSALNHLGALMFGAALAGTFLTYPRLLVRPRYLAGLFGFFLLWWLIELLRIAPDLDFGHRYAAMSEMLLAILLAFVQWRRSKGEPIDRAALRWFMLSLLLGSGLFILTSVTTVSLGWLPPLPQGYAFGFFLFIYIGIGLGLGRYRLFELDVWAYRLLLWVGGALAVVGLDALLILNLDWTSTQALAASLWLVGLIYLPARHWLWRRITRQSNLQLDELVPDVARIAFHPSQPERSRLWDDLLRRLFSPLEHRESPLDQTATRVGEEGLALLLPACASVGARTLRYPANGGRLFTPRDASFADALIQLMKQAESGRDAQERGAAEERQRIARDMHDDVGARLLMLIHHAETPAMAELARAAMSDLRAALSSLDTRTTSLSDSLADWRAEAVSRCEAANVEIQWQADIEQPDLMLSPHQKVLLERALRECLTNALKHTKPQHIEARLVQQGKALALDIINDGQAGAYADTQEGRGLRGIRQRLAEYGGSIEIRNPSPGNWQVSIRLLLISGLAD